MRTPIAMTPWHWSEYECPEDDSRKAVAAIAYHEGQRQQRIQDAWASAVGLTLRGYRSPVALYPGVRVRKILGVPGNWAPVGSHGTIEHDYGPEHIYRYTVCFGRGPEPCRAGEIERLLR